MRRILDDLFIGNARDARDVAGVLDAGICAVIDLALEEAPANYPREIVACRFPLIDGNKNSAAVLRAAVETAVGFVRSGTPTLIACSGGMSRSPAVAAAVLAELEGLDVEAALERVASTGPTDVAPALWESLINLRERELPAEYLAATITTFRKNKDLADKAVGQVGDEKLRVALDEHTNSIAVIMKHVAGNLISRWTDFLTSDGEKPDRHRDDEFVDSFGGRAEIVAYWERGWNCLFAALESLGPADLEKTVFIRGEAHSVPLAIQRSLAHCGYHVGQIVQVARIHCGEEWEVLTIPRGGSATFNRESWGGAPPSEKGN